MATKNNNVPVPSQVIQVRGAREHNLKNVDVDIPKNQLVVITGLSGSGKSSLAFDTIFAEGQRRYVESLSAYARQFLGQMQKPDVDKIEGLSPAIAIDQKSTSHNPRSTVGTITEIYDYMRLLYARIGHPHCPSCGREISTQTTQQIVDAVLGMAAEKVNKNTGWRIMILAPVVKNRKGEFSNLLDDLVRKGFTRARIDGKVLDLQDDISLIKTNRHSIDAIVDRIIIPVGAWDKRGNLSEKGEEIRKRLNESVEQALGLANGTLVLSEVLDASLEFPTDPEETIEHLFSEHFACPNCNISLPELEPRTFSFNSPQGACPECHGLGFKKEVDESRIFNPHLTILEGGIMPWANIGDGDTWLRSVLESVAKQNGFTLDQPVSELTDDIKHLLLHGLGNKKVEIMYRRKSDGQLHNYEARYEGVIPHLKRRYEETQSDYVRKEIEKFMVEQSCPVCLGKRLRPEALSVTILDKNISELTSFSINDLEKWLDELSKSPYSSREEEIARPILKEIVGRVGFLVAVGLEYLTLERTANTLSGGEAQRIRLASQIGSGLSGVLYVLDEPSIGLHSRDHYRLLDTLKSLRDIGNSIVVVEHDYETMTQADHLIELGPGAGEHGGELIAQGTVEEVKSIDASLTGQYLDGVQQVKRPKLKKGNAEGYVEREEEQFLKIVGAEEHNLKKLDVSIPLGKFVTVTGVSGSGKSTLIMDILNKALSLYFYRSQIVPGKHNMIEGKEHIDKVVNIDQSPIGRTPRSNAATYTGVFSYIRDLFTLTPEAKARGYKKGRFSFNVKGGRCENCSGDGQIKIEMQFLPDVYVSCEVCHGDRYNRETLEVLYNGKNISQVLDLTIDEAVEFFDKIPQIRRRLETIQQVGLGYIRLGQPAPTLSGGEAQRVKLASELAKKSTGKTLYILDEPTTGLHFADIQKLLNVLHALVLQGNTILVIEHNLDVIKTADHIIDLGPEGGDKGGEIVATGTVSEVIKNKNSYTGKFLKQYLQS